MDTMNQAESNTISSTSDLEVPWSADKTRSSFNGWTAINRQGSHDQYQPALFS